jgi:catechol 2,3-dioxygenase-like lactoylglutathione lyase family enzyme
MSDLGFTHVALSVRNLSESIAFYTRYAAMKVVHQRTDADVGMAVAWLTDGTRPPVLRNPGSFSVLREKRPVTLRSPWLSSTTSPRPASVVSRK